MKVKGINYMNTEMKLLFLEDDTIMGKIKESDIDFDEEIIIEISVAFIE
jgi:hypothetical protein